MSASSPPCRGGDGGTLTEYCTPKPFVPASVGDHAWDETERQHRLCVPNHTIWTPTISAGTSRSGSPAETGIRPNLTCRGGSDNPDRRSGAEAHPIESGVRCSSIPDRPSIPGGDLAKMRHQKVYSGAVGRTQIYLGDDELELLDRVARTTGASRSELVRRAVRNTFGEKTKAERLQALEASAGAFRGRRLTGADYVDVLRGDLNERLNRQGLG